MPIRRHILWLALALIIGLALNAAAITLLLVPEGQPWPLGSTTNIIGPAAAALPIPVPTPHATPWPAASQWSRTTSFGRTHVATWHASTGQTTHQSDIRLYGWPFRALARERFWWPWSDPAWAKNVKRAGPTTIILWPGALLNTLALALPFWLLLPPLARRFNRRAIRLRRGQCPHCAYDLTGNTTGTCPECGRP